MKKLILCGWLLLMACLLTGCVAQPAPVDAPPQQATQEPTAAPTATATPAQPTRTLLEQQPAPPYLHVSHYVNGEYVNGYIALTERELMEALASSALCDVTDAIALATNSNPSETYGLLPRPLVALAEQVCGFAEQSPADIGSIVSATMTITQLGVTRTQTVEDGAALARLASILKSAQRIQRTGCPWTGVLTLLMSDGTTMTLQKATDSCRTMLFGTAYCYKVSEEDNAWLWALFAEVAPEL